ncbi:hypothetical protein [Streptomyces sp. NBC_01190]|uniref:hypothetical protein n=1 Tax=Streptomyces sp. NBC_01190 TaxID=2903767 RepID=UPI00386BAB57|nr:hypothetical protein OG519_03440 [Streptomyces sp. NBC_01190]
MSLRTPLAHQRTQFFAVAYGFGIVRYTCQGTAPNTFRFDGDISHQVTYIPGTLPCG